MPGTTNINDDLRGPKSHVAKAQKRYSNQLFKKNIFEHRAIVERAKPDIAPADVHCIEELIKIGRVELRAIRFIPKGEAHKKYATIFFIDGTVFVANGVKFSKTIASHLCARSNKQVILIFPLLSPEWTVIQSNQYSARLVEHFYENSKKYQIDRGNLSGIGYSSGAAGIDAVETLCGRNGIRFRKKILVSPLMDLTGSTEKNPKYRAAGKQARLDTQISRQFIDYFVNLAVSEKDRSKPIVSPMWQKRPTETVTEIIVGENDRLLQQSLALYDLRKSKGVNISLFVVEEGTHAMFWRDFGTVYLAADRSSEASTEGEHRVQLAENHLDYKILMNPNQTHN